ncbi:MAG: efflux RND transporter periplasmic adaptor subunit [Gemmatimonadaceae bacterium]
MNRKRLLLLVPVVIIAAIVWSVVRARFAPIIITGIVTTNEVVISPQVAGQVDSLYVREGDQVQRGQLLAVIRPDELRADRAFFASSADAAAGELEGSVAALRLQEETTEQQIKQAEAGLAAAQAQRTSAAADADNAQRALARADALYKTGALTQQELDERRTASSMASARLSAADKQVEAQSAALALARSNAEQNVIKRSQLAAMRAQRAAAAAQRTKADVRLAYTEVRAPVAGIIDTRAVRQGEYVAPGQTVASLVNPDDFWVRADIEESFIDRVRLGDSLTVRLPSGEERPGVVIFRGVDAGFATQRDVSRRKRDIKTFEIRLRLDNKDRRLALGMTAYVIVPLHG